MLLWLLKVATQKLLIETIISVISVSVKAGFVLLFWVNDYPSPPTPPYDAACVIGREGPLDNGSVKV